MLSGCYYFLLENTTCRCCSDENSGAKPNTIRRQFAPRLLLKNIQLRVETFGVSSIFNHVKILHAPKPFVSARRADLFARLRNFRHPL
jgi:hypothetical protein